MRILHVTPLYWPSLGGAEQVTRELSSRLAAVGDDVTVITTDAANDSCFWDRHSERIKEREQQLDGVRVIRVPVQSFPLGQLGLFAVRGIATRVLNPLGLHTAVRRVGGWMPRVPTFTAALRSLSGEFDVVHGFNLSWESCLVDACEFAHERRYRSATTPFLHTGEAGSRRVWRNYSMSHQRAALRGSQLVLVQTPTETRAVEALGVDRGRILETGVGIQPEQLAGGDANRFRVQYQIAGPIVAFIGRVMHDKGAATLVRAMQRLWEQGCDAQLVIAGHVMPDFARFLRRAERAPLPRLHVLGPIGPGDKRDLLAAANMVAMPSRAESFGIVYLEAWAYSKPVIGARAGGVPDVVDDEVNGLLVTFDDVSALAQAIDRLLRDPAQAVTLGAQGHLKLKQRYTWDRIFHTVREAYLALIEQA